MPYEVFCQKVSAITRRAGSSVRFHHEDGKHIASCSGGVTIVGNTLSRAVSVRWGSGHQARTVIL